MSFLVLAILMLNHLIEGTFGPAPVVLVLAALNDFFVKVRLLWVCVVMKYACQFVNNLW